MSSAVEILKACVGADNGSSPTSYTPVQTPTPTHPHTHTQEATLPPTNPHALGQLQS